MRNVQRTPHLGIFTSPGSPADPRKVDTRTGKSLSGLSAVLRNGVTVRAHGRCEYCRIPTGGQVASDILIGPKGRDRIALGAGSGQRPEPWVCRAPTWEALKARDNRRIEGIVPPHQDGNVIHTDSQAFGRVGLPSAGAILSCLGKRPSIQPRFRNGLGSHKAAKTQRHKECGGRRGLENSPIHPERGLDFPPKTYGNRHPLRASCENRSLRRFRASHKDPNILPLPPATVAFVRASPAWFD